MKIEINNRNYDINPGETILDVLNRNGIRVPTLCHIRDMFPSGACRMCLVEDAGSGRLITSCSYPAEEGMKIMTHSPRVVEARRTIVEMLVGNHPADCLYCNRNSKCELQTLSGELGIKERVYRKQQKASQVDRSGISVVRDQGKCILCGRCVRICEEVMGVSAIDFVNRGSKTAVSPAFGQGLNTSSCVNCGQCIMVCPTGALGERNQIAVLETVLKDPGLTTVVQYAPAIPVSLSEEFNLPVGKDLTGILNAALRKIGFARVFDTTIAADLTIMEETAELIRRVETGQTMPMITSCCPAWIKYAEEFYPDLLPNLSTCKSPQQMLGAVIKNFWAVQEGINPAKVFTVSVMPCTAKKFEARREEMLHGMDADVDLVITTRELASMIRMMGIDMASLAPEATDSPLGVRSSAGKLFAASGGVMEAAIRTAYYHLTGSEMVQYCLPDLRSDKGRKEATLEANGIRLGVAVVHGLANAARLMDEIRAGRKDLHFIEVMACPGGCIAGGGQHIGAATEKVRERAQALYDIDDTESLKVSHKNPEVLKLYKSFLGEPLGHRSHDLLHTHYSEREVIR